MNRQRGFWPVSIIISLLGSLLYLYSSDTPINFVLVVLWAFIFYVTSWVGRDVVVKIRKGFRDKNEKEKE
jgi:hypothetical protein